MKIKLLYYYFFNKKKYRNYTILKWINNAKIYFINSYWCKGMCYAFEMTMPKCFKKEWIKLYPYSDTPELINYFISEYYPEFFGTHKIEYDEELDNNEEEGYWWKLDDKESRIKAFDKLIKIYEQKCVQ